MSTAAAKRNIVLRLMYDKPFFLDKKETAWRARRFWIGVALTVLTIIAVVLVSIVFPAKIAGTGYGAGGWKVTMRSPITSGLPAAGDFVIASDSGAGLRSNTRIVESLFKSHDIVKIIAVPGDSLSYDGQAIAVNGNPTKYFAQIPSGGKLSAQYLVLCKAGNCQRDSIYTIPTKNVIGQVSWDEQAERAARIKDGSLKAGS